jgi:hypothetical protein
MFSWFVGTAVVTVWFVFRDPRFDYRLLVVGSLVVDLDALTGGMWVMHTLVFSVVLLAAVMVATAGRKPSRRLLLALPIGTFLHLVFDGAWATKDVFWWPLGGVGFDGTDLPSVQRGWWNIPLELIGWGLLLWVARTAGLGDPVRRQQAWRTGELRPC